MQVNLLMEWDWMDRFISSGMGWMNGNAMGVKCTRPFIKIKMQ